MKSSTIRNLLHTADDEALRRIACHPASDAAARERIRRRLTAQITDPEQERFAEQEHYHVPTERRIDRFRGIAVGVAACMVLGLTTGALLSLRHHTPLQPGTELIECRVPIYTPFGDITQTQPIFQYSDASTQAMQAQIRENIAPDAILQLERTIPTECVQALGEVFRVYGWRDMVNDQNPDDTITDDCIVMHLCENPENHSGEYLTAYFQMDDTLDTNYVRVDANGETRWFPLDAEIIRCLRSAVIDLQTPVYQPPERAFTEVMSRIMGVTDENGNRLATMQEPGEWAALSTLLNRSTLYEWNTLRELDPCHGRALKVQLMTSNGTESLTFYLDTGCLQYQITHTMDDSQWDVLAYGSDTRYSYYWVDEGAFMEAAEKLLRNRIYPGCPMELSSAVLTDVPETVTAPDFQEQLSTVFERIEWKETACPYAADVQADHLGWELDYTDADTNVNGAHSIRFYPDSQVIEWTEEHHPYTFVSADGMESRIVSHYFAVPPEVWEQLYALFGTAPGQEDIPADAENE